MNNISSEYLRSVLGYEPETGVLTWKARSKITHHTVHTWNKRFAGKPAGYKGYDKYIRITLKGFNKRIFMAHRLVWLIMTGDWPQDQIDHINHNRADNRWVNLRAVSARENLMNSNLRSDNTSGFVGVFWDNDLKKWRASITTHRETKYLGVFDSKEDAVIARKKAANDLNFHENHGGRCFVDY